MAIKEVVLTNEELNEEIKEGFSIVIFHAEWCPPCCRIIPLLEEVSELEEFKDIRFLKLNIDDEINIETARKLGMITIPLVFIFKNGIEMDSFNSGKVKKDEIIEWINLRLE